MTKNPSMLAEPVISKNKAEDLAYYYLREKIGNIPHIRGANLLDGKWVIPIDVNYPKIFLDRNTGKPNKTRFIKVTDIGKLEISSMSGEVLHAPKLWDIEREINNGLAKIQVSVQQALVKTAAANFSKLPFSEHRYTPILDILSILLTEERFKISDFVYGEDQSVKYRQYLTDLEEIGLVRINEGYVIPGNLFSTLEGDFSGSKDSEKLSLLLKLFFEKGYGHIRSVMSVLGSHLKLSGFTYQESLEYGGLLSFNRGDVLDAIDDEYKRIKIPRYFLQLEGIGLVTRDPNARGSAWTPEKGIFNRVRGQTEILSSVNEMIKIY